MGALVANPSAMELFHHGLLVVVLGMLIEFSSAMELFHHGLFGCRVFDATFSD